MASDIEVRATLARSVGPSWTAMTGHSPRLRSLASSAALQDQLSEALGAGGAVSTVGGFGYIRVNAAAALLAIVGAHETSATEAMFTRTWSTTLANALGRWYDSKPRIFDFDVMCIGEPERCAQSSMFPINNVNMVSSLHSGYVYIFTTADMALALVEDARAAARAEEVLVTPEAAPVEAPKPPTAPVQAGMAGAWPWLLGAGAVAGVIFWASRK